MKRENPENPILAIGGVIIKGSKILLAKRGKPPDLGKWSIPGGVVEAGETLEEALKREILEECSLKILKAEPFLIIERIFSENKIIKYHYVIFDFLISEFYGEFAASSDVVECKFFYFSEIRNLNVSKSLLCIENYINEFKKERKLLHIVSKEEL